jgi:alkylated DNA nucleotide flippase Atl1
MRTKKSWREKLADSKGLPKVGRIDEKMSSRWGTGTMVVPAPMEVHDIMRQVPKGKLVTINEIRALLASKHMVTIACPITTGIFAWIAAHAAAEAAEEGTLRTTPYWRTLRTGGELSAKFPGGISGVREKLEAEGHKVLRKGKRYFVENFEKALCKPNHFELGPTADRTTVRPRPVRTTRPESRAQG